MSTQRRSSTSSAHWSYDVFISFRGEDTRNKFTDHLHDALERKRIFVFKDDKGLRKGKFIAPELSKAIEDSRISIIVFSRNYASSTWCLDELVHIIQCMGDKRQIVIPIFYDVDPSTVRKQTKIFEEAFAEHEKKDREKVQNWRNALKEVANISGFHLKDSLETKVIRDVIKEIDKLIPKRFRIEEDLVGINSRLKKLMTLLTSTNKPNDVQMIGIYGMGGIGKTTITRVVCDLISHQFDGVSFLEHVRETFKGSNGDVCLQQKLISQILGEIYTIPNVGNGINMIRRMMGKKKVLVVIDDVDEIEQLSYLVGKHHWFGSGSRIIITTRDKHLLMTHGVDKLYQAEQLNFDEALQLFSLKAFKNYQPPENFLKLSREVVDYASSLPLALKVLGSFLFGRTTDKWESAIRRLGKDFDKKILDCLEVSFDGLNEIEKKIFLDIACFFKGEDKDHVIRILDGCNLEPIIGINVLEEKCLLTISNNTLEMHDLLQEMGQQIVKRKSLEEPGKRSRIWKKADFLHILAKKTGTEIVEGIMFENDEHLNVSATAFSNMANLRLLKIPNIHFFEGIKYLPTELCLLVWRGCSLKSLPLSLQLDKTVALHLQCSCIGQLWKEIQPLQKLKVIDLSHSKIFKKTPDFTEVPNLEELNLEGCIRLYDVHPSLLVHKKLILLNMKDCTSLTTLPSEIAMESLKRLVLSGCLKLKKFPYQISGSMECLAELFLDRTAIKELPSSIQLLTGLVLLSLEDCKNLISLPSTINSLKSLKTLKLSGCEKIENLPDNFGQIETLEVLDIRGTAKREPVSDSWYSRFPLSLMSRKNSCPLTLKLPSLSGLISLKELHLSYRNIEVIPNDIGNLVSLQELYLEGNNFASLPASINRLSMLTGIFLNGCKRLQSVPELPSNVEYIILQDCISLETLSINTLKPHPFSVISCDNCLKLFNYDGGSTLLSALKKKPKSHVLHKETFVVVPGSEMPKWFKYQSESSSMKLKGDRDLKLKGYALCVVFFVHKLPPGLREPRSFHLRCNISMWSNKIYEVDPGEGLADHLWLSYIPVDAMKRPEDWYDFELKYYSMDNPRLEVRRCGAHPIYEQEVEELCNSYTSGNLIEFHQDSVIPKFDLTDYDGAETSTGSADSDHDEPQPKRHKST